MARKMAFHEMPEEELLWKDTKRWLGMPLTFTHYSVDSQRLYVKKGFFKTEMDELLLYRILDIKATRTLGQRLFGVGTITIYGTDQSDHTLLLENIRHVDKVRRFLSQLVEEIRVSRGVAGREIYGTGAVGMNHDDCIDDHDPFDDQPEA